VRAGRLLNLLMLLHRGGRHTAAELADRLGVSERTVLRDIEALSGAGVPVYGTRGPGGGFELLDTFEQTVPALPPGLAGGRAQVRRVRVRIAPATLQVALVTGAPAGWRRRPRAEPAPDRPDWLEGSFRFDSDEAAIRELVALAPGVEVLLPVELRRSMAEIGRQLVRLHRPPLGDGLGGDARQQPSA
jgi:predicted DNA-binding transcriptional regulator YafY